MKANLTTFSRHRPASAIEKEGKIGWGEEEELEIMKLWCEALGLIY